MMGDEWLGIGSSGNHVHHRCLDLKEIQFVKVTSHEFDDFSSSKESVSSFVVNDEIKESFSISSLIVSKSNIKFRKHMKTRREKNDFSWSYR